MFAPRFQLHANPLPLQCVKAAATAAIKLLQNASQLKLGHTGVWGKGTPLKNMSNITALLAANFAAVLHEIVLGDL